jgi:hypothetical protein
VSVATKYDSPPSRLTRRPSQRAGLGLFCFYEVAGRARLSFNVRQISSTLKLKLSSALAVSFVLIASAFAQTPNPTKLGDPSLEPFFESEAKGEVPLPFPFQKGVLFALRDTFRESIIVDRCVYGDYAAQASPWRIKLFPDHTAVITSFSDLPPEFCLAEGTWRFFGKDLVLNWHWLSRSQSVMKEFVGSCEKMRLILFVRNDGKTSVLLKSVDQLDNPAPSCFVQTEHFVDWQELKRNIQK